MTTITNHESPKQNPLSANGSDNTPSTTFSSLKDQRQMEAREYRLFRGLDRKRKQYVLPGDVKKSLTKAGLSLDDVRVKESVTVLKKYNETDKISYGEFRRIIRPNFLIIEKAMKGGVILPSYQDVCSDITTIYKGTPKSQTKPVAPCMQQTVSVDLEQLDSPLYH